MKFNKSILIAIGVFTGILVLTPKYVTGNVKEKSELLEVAITPITEHTTIPQDELEDYVINVVLDDWKTYRDAQYVPSLENRIYSLGVTEDDVEYKNVLERSLDGVKLNPNFYEILGKLNPYKTTSKVYKSGIDLAYGVTQINVKLIPFGTVLYRDFKSNPKSQLLFLNFYIETKMKSGYTVEDIIQQYKYCNYN